MSYNRETRAYRKRLRKFVNDLSYGPMVREDDDGTHHDVPLVDQLVAHAPGAPRYFVEDGMELFIQEHLDLAEFSERQAREYRQKAADMIAVRAELHRPKVKLVLVGGSNA